MNFFLPPQVVHFLEQATGWVWHTSLAVALPFLILLVLGRWTGFPARARLILGTLLMIRLLLPVVPSIPGHPLRGFMAEGSAEAVLRTQGSVTPAEDGVVLPASTTSVSAAALPAEAGWAAGRLPSSLALVWAGGFVVVSLWMVGSHFALGRMIRRQSGRAPEAVVSHLDWAREKLGMSRPISVSVVPGLPTVALWGWWKPLILVPPGLVENYTGDEVRGMLVHELAHVQRQDVLVTWLGMAACALHWFNPLAWFALRRLRADRELECDRLALAVLNGEQRMSYGFALLKTMEAHLASFASATPRPAAPTSAALVPFGRHEPDIQTRIRMIASPIPRTWWHRLGMAVVPVLAFLAFTTAQADGDGSQKKEAGAAAESKDGDRPREGDRPRDGDGRKAGPRDGDGDGGTKRPGPREGDDDGNAKKTGPRDGEVRKAGPRDGEAKKADPPELVARSPRAIDGDKAGSVLTIHLDGNDGMSLGEGKVSEEGLLEVLRKSATMHPDTPVVIRAAENTPYKQVTRVLELCRQASIWNVSFATKGS